MCPADSPFGSQEIGTRVACELTVVLYRRVFLPRGDQIYVLTANDKRYWGSSDDGRCQTDKTGHSAPVG